MAQRHGIRSAFFQEGKSIATIAKEHTIDPKTARKYINTEDWNQPLPAVKAIHHSIMAPYVHIVRQWLTDDKQRRRKQRHTARRVYTRLVDEHGFTGSYRTVANSVRSIRAEVYPGCSAAIPLQHIPGEAQVDFGEADYIHHGTRVSGSYLVVSFPASNAGFLQLTPGQNQECLFEALIAIFLFLGGVPMKIWLDNASTMVRKVLRNGGRELTDRFRRFQEHFGFEVSFCNPRKGNEKGNVEGKVGYLRRNLLVPEPAFDSLDQFNKALLTSCMNDLYREHYRHDHTIAHLFTADRAALMALPRLPFDPARYELMRADGYGMIALDGSTHRYSTAPQYAGSRVMVQITAQTVSILDESRRAVVTHQRLYRRGHGQRMDWMPYLTQLSRRPTALKYTPVYTMMPDVLQTWVASQPRDQVGTALKLVADLSKTAGFDTACAAIADSIAAGITDGDSLVALHERNTRYAPLLPRPVRTKSTITAPGVQFQPACYDQILTNRGVK